MNIRCNNANETAAHSRDSSSVDSQIVVGPSSVLSPVAGTRGQAGVEGNRQVLLALLELLPSREKADNK